MPAVAVATWNLDTLYRPVPHSGPLENAAYEAKLDALARTITALAPQVLAVQEVGDPAALRDLAKRLGGKWFRELAEPDTRGSRVGVLSRLALGQVEQVSEFPDQLPPVRVDDDGNTQSRMSRPALRARAGAGGRAIDVISAHLTSKPSGCAAADDDQRVRQEVYAVHRRAAESAAVRAYVTELLEEDGHNRPLVVAGCLNDEPQAATTQLLYGPPGSKTGPGGGDKCDGARLWNLQAHIVQERRYSRVRGGRPELVDHLLVSHALVHTVTSVDTAPPGAADIGSDHRPVIARFDLP